MANVNLSLDPVKLHDLGDRVRLATAARDALADAYAEQAKLLKDLEAEHAESVKKAGDAFAELYNFVTGKECE